MVIHTHSDDISRKFVGNMSTHVGNNEFQVGWSWTVPGCDCSQTRQWKVQTNRTNHGIGWWSHHFFRSSLRNPDVRWWTHLIVGASPTKGWSQIIPHLTKVMGVPPDPIIHFDRWGFSTKTIQRFWGYPHMWFLGWPWHLDRSWLSITTSVVSVSVFWWCIRHRLLRSSNWYLKCVSINIKMQHKK